MCVCVCVCECIIVQLAGVYDCVFMGTKDDDERLLGGQSSLLNCLLLAKPTERKNTHTKNEN